ncbi:MAG: biotin-dependent carboxyltransferase family protein [Rubritalea sp.]|uniref:5-oxoprolinase subunit C family protein n=1 Tax=Rubritalea sp. TaxID=2109375 RepID=UPI003241E55F
MTPSIAKVRQLGAGISFQDQGRIGSNSWLNYGVAPAGTIDSFAASAANSLVHNLANDTVLELMLGGAEIEVLHGCWLAHVGGHQCKQLPSGTGRYVHAGELLRFTPSANGVWSYLAISSGWEAGKVFGSASRHHRSNLGDAIQIGSELHAPSAQPSPQPRVVRRTPGAEQRDYTEPPSLRLYPGPQTHLLTEAQIQQVTQHAWTISSRSDRTGYRLLGDASSQLRHTNSIHSTPTLVGSMQLPPSGEPIVTLHDGPTVGGYPIIGVLHPDDISWLVQQHAQNNVSFRFV